MTTSALPVKGAVSNEESIERALLKHYGSSIETVESVIGEIQESGGEGYGVWRTGAYEAEKTVEIGTSFYPTFGKTAAFWANSHTLALPVQKARDEAKVAASMKLINWLTNNTIMWTKAGHVPSHLGGAGRVSLPGGGTRSRAAPLATPGA